MSIKNEIERLQNAKSGIVSAITRKGVSVPKDVKLDGMEELIDDIEAGIDTSDATASADEILQGKTAYVDGEKVTGTIPTFDGSYTCSGESTGGDGEDVTEETNAYTEKLVTLENAIAALETELEGKASGGGVVIEALTGTVSIGTGTGTIIYVDETLTTRKLYISNGQDGGAMSPATITIAANTFVTTNEGYAMYGNNIEVLGTYESSVRPTSNNFEIYTY